MNQIEKYYKDVINWKFFNLLKDVATKFEDRDLLVDIYIQANSKNYHELIETIIYYYQGDEEYFPENFLSEAEFNQHKKVKPCLYYAIYIRDLDRKVHTDALLEFWNSIKRKCKLIVGLEDKKLVVIPK